MENDRSPHDFDIKLAHLDTVHNLAIRITQISSTLLFKCARTYEELCYLMAEYIIKRIPMAPTHFGPPFVETTIMSSELVDINRAGFITYGSQIGYDADTEDNNSQIAYESSSDYARGFIYGYIPNDWVELFKELAAKEDVGIEVNGVLYVHGNNLGTELGMNLSSETKDPIPYSEYYANDPPKYTDIIKSTSSMMGKHLVKHLTEVQIVHCQCGNRGITKILHRIMLQIRTAFPEIPEELQKEFNNIYAMNKLENLALFMAQDM